MNAEQGSTRSTQARTGMMNKVCPKCKRRTLHRDGKTPTGKQRWTCCPNKVHCYSTTNPDATYRDQNGRNKEADKNPQFRRKLAGVKRFVITSAQNATPIHDKFFGALRNYCDANDAELVVIPIRYKNATSVWTASQANEERWDPALTPYLYNQRKKLNDNLMLMGDIKTHPTAVKPLSGFESITHGESGIFGHTKVQMCVIPTPHSRFPKILATTGAVTVKNYTDSRRARRASSITLSLHSSLKSLARNSLSVTSTQ